MKERGLTIPDIMLTVVPVWPWRCACKENERERRFVADIACCHDYNAVWLS